MKITPELKKFPFPKKRWLFNLSDKVLKYRQTVFNSYLALLITGNKQQSMQSSQQISQILMENGSHSPPPAPGKTHPTASTVLAPDELNLFLMISQHVSAQRQGGGGIVSTNSINRTGSNASVGGGESRDYSFSARHGGGYLSGSPEDGGGDSRDSMSSMGQYTVNAVGLPVNKNRAGSFGTLTNNVLTVNDFKLIKVLGKGRWVLYVYVCLVVICL